MSTEFLRKTELSPDAQRKPLSPPGAKSSAMGGASGATRGGLIPGQRRRVGNDFEPQFCGLLERKHVGRIATAN